MTRGEARDREKEEGKDGDRGRETEGLRGREEKQTEIIRWIGR